MDDAVIKERVIHFFCQLVQDRTNCHAIQVLSPQSLHERTEIQLDNTFKSIEISLNCGFAILKKEISLQSDSEKNKALDSLNQIMAIIREWNLDDPAANLCKPSHELCEPLYLIGRDLVLKKQYEEASHVFVLLLILQPHIELIWLGLAIAEQNLNHFDRAIFAYEQVLALNPSHEFSKRALEEIDLMY